MHAMVLCAPACGRTACGFRDAALLKQNPRLRSRLSEEALTNRIGAQHDPKPILDQLCYHGTRPQRKGELQLQRVLLREGVVNPLQGARIQFGRPAQADVHHQFRRAVDRGVRRRNAGGDGCHASGGASRQRTPILWCAKTAGYVLARPALPGSGMRSFTFSGPTVGLTHAAATMFPIPGKIASTAIAAIPASDFLGPTRDASGLIRHQPRSRRPNPTPGILAGRAPVAVTTPSISPCLAIEPE